MNKGWVTAVLLVGLLVGLVEGYLPGYYEKQVEAGLADQVQAADYIDVQLSSHPAVLLLLGRIQHGSLHVKGVTLEGVRVEELRAEYRDLVIAKTPEGAGAASGTNTFFEATFREEDLNRYLTTRFTGLQGARLDLTPAEAVLSVEVPFLKTTLPLRVKGTFSIPNSHTIRFTLQGIDVGQVNLPSSLVSGLLQQMEFDLDLAQYPFPLELREVRLEQDGLRVLGGTAE